MKKILIISVIILISIHITAVSQTGDRAQQILKEITVEQFEDAGFWYGSIAGDIGLITLNLREGKPRELYDETEARIKEDAKYSLPPGKYVLGVKVRFYRRTISSFSVTPIRPIPIEGITKRISVWVAGRNFKHSLKLVIQDYFGELHELNMGELTFRGWQKLSVTVPGNIIQDEYHYSDRAGLKIVGFKVDCDLLESYGTFYMYFDDISAETDLFAEEYKDEDDIPDNW